MNRKPIILVGAGGHCDACIDVIENSSIYKIIGIVDKTADTSASNLGYPVIGEDDDLADLRKSCAHALIAVGQIQSPAVRIRLFQLLKSLDFTLPVITSKRAYISRHALVNEGTIVMHNVTINAGARIGANCIINTNALIEHDCQVGDHCHVSTGSILNGGTQLGDESFFGSGAVCVQNTLIPKKSFIKATSLVK